MDLLSKQYVGTKSRRREKGEVVSEWEEWRSTNAPRTAFCRNFVLINTGLQRFNVADRFKMMPIPAP